MTDPVRARYDSCGWCTSTHIAEISCKCVEPCDRAWCPAYPGNAQPARPEVPRFRPTVADAIKAIRDASSEGQA